MKKKFSGYILLSLGMLIYFAILGLMFIKLDESSSKGRIEDSKYSYTGEVVTVFSDGTYQELELPCKLASVEPGQIMNAELILPDDISDKDVICIDASHESMKVFIKDIDEYKTTKSGTEIYQYDSTKKFFGGRISISKEQYIPVTSQMAGKVLRIETYSDSAMYSGRIEPLLIGDKLGLIQYHIELYITELLAGLVLFLLGFIAVVICIFITLLWIKKMLPLSYFALGVSMLGLWSMCENRLRVFIFSDVVLAAELSHLLIILYVCMLMVYFDEVQGLRYHRHYVVAECLAAISIVLLGALHALRIADLIQTRVVGLLEIVVMCIMVTTTIIIDIINGKVENYKYVAFSFFLVDISGIVEGIMDLVYHNIHTGLYLNLGGVIAIIFASINTVKNLLEEQREKTMIAARGELQSKFLAIMSHELRTPINSILGMNEMILRESREKEIRRYAREIDYSGKNLKKIIGDVLDVSGINEGRIELVPSEYSLVELVKTLYHEFNSSVKRKQLDFKITVEESLPSVMFGDQMKIHQIVANLLGNAVKYTEEGCISLKITQEKESLIVDTKAADDSNENDERLILKIEVLDTGRGISKDFLPYIFDEFKRTDDVYNTAIEGTGLGLSITHGLVKLMNGEIVVNSELHKGSEFIVTIPQTIVSKEPVGDLWKDQYGEAESYYHESFTAPNARILVVDDSEPNLLLAGLLLKRTLINIDDATSGTEALKKIESNSYDLILLDYMMPDINGSEVFHRMKSQNLAPNTPVIIMTANVLSESKERFVKMGFSACLSKPIDGERLESMVMRWLPQEKVIPWTADEKHSQVTEDEIQKKVRKVFYETLQTKTERIIESHDELKRNLSLEAFASYKVLVHGMKGSAALVGFGDLSEVAKENEIAAKRGDFESIEKVYYKLIAELKDINAEALKSVE